MGKQALSNLISKKLCKLSQREPHLAMQAARQHMSFEQCLLLVTNSDRPHAAFAGISTSAHALILASHVPLVAGAKSRLLIGNNFSNVPRLLNPRTLIFPVHKARVGFSTPVL